MAGTGTKDRILDAAERLFAERGFDATSLRAITAEAKANLAAVNYHFTSKEALLQALFARRLGALNEARLAMLDACEAEAGGQPVPLEKLMRALIEPVLRLGGSPSAGGTGFGILLGRMYSAPSGFPRTAFADELRTLVDRFQAALRRTLPELPHEELFWRIFFAIGSMAHTLAGAGILRIISHGQCDTTDVDRTVERLIAFVSAGIRAPLPDQASATRRPLRARRASVHGNRNGARKASSILR
jgi:AcrR family transcriptional regulator